MEVRFEIIQRHGTGTYWDKKMWTAEGEDVVREVQEYVNRGK